MSTDEIEQAVQILSDATHDGSIVSRRKLLKVLSQVRRKLLVRPQSTAHALVDALLRGLKRQTAFLSRPPQEAVGKDDSLCQDVRIEDLHRGSQQPTEQERFRYFLAARDLALEEERWELGKYRTSRINDLSLCSNAQYD